MSLFYDCPAQRESAKRWAAQRGGVPSEQAQLKRGDEERKADEVDVRSRSQMIFRTFSNLRWRVIQFRRLLKSPSPSCDLCYIQDCGVRMVEYDTLLASAIRGCMTCSTLHKGILKILSPSEISDIRLVVWNRGLKDVRVLSKSSFDFQTELEFFIAPSGAGRLKPPELLQKCPLPGNTGSQPSFCHAREWLQHCLNNHATCKETEIGPLPTRLLRVEGTDQPFRVFLVVTETTAKHDQYICLSHCWGSGVKRCITTKSNFRERLSGIPWNELPKTFKDAIVISRRLGEQYLWIDSMCIIQDDEDDWRREAANMKSIYEHGLLTIAAAWSRNDEGGCFSDAKGYHVGLPLSSSWSKQHQSLFVRKRLAHYVSQVHRWGTFDEFPAFGRAWIFQERLLSRRVLYFGESELYWECKVGASCECSLIPNRSAGESISHGEGYKAEQTRCITQRNTEEVAERWWEIIEEYSCLSLTKNKDKLPALSGIAQKFQPILGTRYLAGMWESTFLSDLAWYGGNHFTVPKPDDWRAPSWSWASVNSIIIHEHHYWTGKRFLAHLQSVECVQKGNDTYGELVDGFALLSGKLISGTLQHSWHRGLYGMERRYTLTVDGFNDLGYSETIDIFPDYDLEHPGKHCVPPGSAIQILELIVGFSDCAAESHSLDCIDPQKKPCNCYISISAMVLRRTIRDEQAFERIGYLKYDIREWATCCKWLQNSELRAPEIVRLL